MEQLRNYIALSHYYNSPIVINEILKHFEIIDNVVWVDNIAWYYYNLNPKLTSTQIDKVIYILTHCKYLAVKDYSTNSIQHWDEYEQCYHY